MNIAKETIQKTGVIYNLKARNIFDYSVEESLKRKNDSKEPLNNNDINIGANNAIFSNDNDNDINKVNNHINIKIGFSPVFEKIKSSLYKTLSKNFPKDVNKLSDMSDESDYYLTLSKSKFLAYKSDKILIFMSPLQAQLLYQYHEHVFIDGTFYIAPKSSYLVMTIRINNIYEDIYHTAAYGIIENKELGTYIEFLSNIKEYVYQNIENKSSEEKKEPKHIHYDFELAIIAAIKQVYPNTEIKLCLWHLFRNIEINRKKIYDSIDNQSTKSKDILKRIKSLCYLDPEYENDVFALI